MYDTVFRQDKAHHSLYVYGKLDFSFCFNCLIQLLISDFLFLPSTFNSAPLGTKTAALFKHDSTSLSLGFGLQTITTFHSISYAVLAFVTGLHETLQGFLHSQSICQRRNRKTLLVLSCQERVVTILVKLIEFREKD